MESEPSRRMVLLSGIAGAIFLPYSAHAQNSESNAGKIEREHVRTLLKSDLDNPQVQRGLLDLLKRDVSTSALRVEMQAFIRNPDVMHKLFRIIAHELFSDALMSEYNTRAEHVRGSKTRIRLFGSFNNGVSYYYSALKLLHIETGDALFSIKERTVTAEDVDLLTRGLKNFTLDGANFNDLLLTVVKARNNIPTEQLEKIRASIWNGLEKALFDGSINFFEAFRSFCVFCRTLSEKDQYDRETIVPELFDQPRFVQIRNKFGLEFASQRRHPEQDTAMEKDIEMLLRLPGTKKELLFSQSAAWYPAHVLPLETLQEALHKGLFR
jgi:hypothetical protein